MFTIGISSSPTCRHRPSGPTGQKADNLTFFSLFEAKPELFCKKNPQKHQTSANRPHLPPSPGHKPPPASVVVGRSHRSYQPEPLTRVGRVSAKLFIFTPLNKDVSDVSSVFWRIHNWQQTLFIKAEYRVLPTAGFQTRAGRL